MHWKGANRLYSRQSLQRWGFRLDAMWENGFAPEVVKAGRKLYRKGLIREISLNEDDVIMTCRIGKQDSYSVVEWESERMTVRSSTEDSEFGHAIAVAGLLEIEELLADESISLIDENPLIEDEAVPKEELAIASEEDSGPASPEDIPTRMLHLVLDTHVKGLICEAFWIDEDGSRVSALSHEDGSPRANTTDERGRLIVLAARARKSHFDFSPEFGGYLLENAREIVFFIQNVWPSWKRWFSTQERENIQHIKQGITEIHLGAKVGTDRKGKLDVRWVFDSGRKALELDVARDLLRRDNDPALVPELGIVKLAEESKRLLHSWEGDGQEGDGRGEFYNLFSLFAEEDADVELSEELHQWRDRLLSDGPDEKRYLDCLRHYQKEGVVWMDRLLSHGCHCLLADEMGLGKTLQVIALLNENWNKGQRALVVCPASVVPVWISEFAKFAPHFEVGRYEGRKASRDKRVLDVVVISYALLRSRIEILSKDSFDYAVIDEAQFIKNPDSKVSLSCRRIKADRRIALTGTPIENKPLDIWPAFQFLMPGLLGSRSSFERRLSDNPGAFKARLRLQTRPFMLRRTKSDVAKELPDKVLITQACPITPLQAQEYSRICEEGLARLGDDFGAAIRSNRFAALALLTRLRQVSCDPHLLPWLDAELEDSGKLMVLLEKLIEVLGTGHKVVIFSQFTRFLKRIRTMIETSFPDLPIFEITGSTQNREAPVSDFQKTDQTAAMLVSLRAASVGITLHSADYVFLLDPWWNPAVENQAIDRVHRIGQLNTVFVYKMVASGTIEDKIQELQNEKRELFDSLISHETPGVDLLARGVKSLQALLALAQGF